MIITKRTTYTWCVVQTKIMAKHMGYTHPKLHWTSEGMWGSITLTQFVSLLTISSISSTFRKKNAKDFSAFWRYTALVSFRMLRFMLFKYARYKQHLYISENCPVFPPFWKVWKGCRDQVQRFDVGWERLVYKVMAVCPEGVLKRTLKNKKLWALLGKERQTILKKNYFGIDEKWDEKGKL